MSISNSISKDLTFRIELIMSEEKENVEVGGTGNPGMYFNNQS